MIPCARCTTYCVDLIRIVFLVQHFCYNFLEVKGLALLGGLKKTEPNCCNNYCVGMECTKSQAGKKKLKSESAITITITLHCLWAWYLKPTITITYTRDQVSLSLVLATNYHYHWQERPQKTWELSDAKIRSASLAPAQLGLKRSSGKVNKEVITLSKNGFHRPESTNDIS